MLILLLWKQLADFLIEKNNNQIYKTEFHFFLNSETTYIYVHINMSMFMLQYTNMNTENEHVNVRVVSMFTVMVICHVYVHFTYIFTTCPRS